MAERKKTLSEYEQEIVKLLKAEFKSRGELIKYKNKFYRGLIRKYRHLLDEALPVKQRTNWDFKKCYEDAKKHRTKKEWQAASPSAFFIAYRNKWSDKCCKHMEVKLKKWTLNECKIDAKKYSSRKEWHNKSNSAYDKARRNGWLDECCKHMQDINDLKILCIETGKIYLSTIDAVNKTGITTIYDCLKGRQKTAGGYHWAYCEEE